MANRPAAGRRHGWWVPTDPLLVGANLGWHRFPRGPSHPRMAWICRAMQRHRGAGQRPARPAFTAHKEKPRCVSSGVLGINPGDDLLSHGLSHTTIGAAAFHFRVRDGIGWFHSANFTREAFGESHSSLGDKAPASHSSCDVACTWMLLRRCRKAKAT